MMKEIPLTKGMFAIVDDDDYERVSKYKWCLRFDGYNYYGYSNRLTGKKSPRWETLILHRFIMGEPDGFHVDHINGNGLDCRKSNLRVCTSSQNQWNSKRRRDNRSGYKGVSFHKVTGKWSATIQVKNKRLHIGLFSTPEKAARAYDEVATLNFGEFARVNFPPKLS